MMLVLDSRIRFSGASFLGALMCCALLTVSMVVVDAVEGCIVFCLH